jgi:hypothetical protein
VRAIEQRHAVEEEESFGHEREGGECGGAPAFLTEFLRGQLGCFGCLKISTWKLKPRCFIFPMNVKTIAEAMPAEPLHRVRRARHFHRSGYAYLVAALLFLAMVALVSFVTFGVLMALTRDRNMGLVALASCAAFVLLRLIAAWHTRKLTCGLCHGTLLHEKRCLKHERAEKWPLLGHRSTAVLRIIFTLGFTCMYCGTPYRLRK